MSSMFWGLRLEPGKRYTATVDKPFHVSMAALDCASITNDDIQTVMLEEESNTPFILCNLQRLKVLQARLDLNFVPGNRVTFFCRGTGSVHLTGYILPEDDDCTFDDGEEEEDDEQAEEEDEDDDEEEEEDEIDDDEDFADLKRALRKAHRKQEKLNGVSSKRKSEGASGVPDSKKKKTSQKKESEDDSDSDVEAEEEAADFDEDGEEEHESADSGEDDTGNTDETFSSPPVQEKKSRKKKKNKQKQGSPQQEQQQGKQKQNATNGSPPEFVGQQKKKAKLEGGNEKSDSPGAKTLDNGVSIKDTKVGNGPVCKPGKQVTVYYTGRLKSNNKVFDQTQQGPGFKFRLGRGEVIKGWDVGVVGMKVGGKRRLICPPSTAYGHKGSPPTIPPNSTLIFDVEVKAVN